MDVVDKIYSGYGEKPSQGHITNVTRAHPAHAISVTSLT